MSSWMTKWRKRRWRRRKSNSNNHTSQQRVEGTREEEEECVRCEADKTSSLLVCGQNAV